MSDDSKKDDPVVEAQGIGYKAILANIKNVFGKPKEEPVKKADEQPSGSNIPHGSPAAKVAPSNGGGTPKTDYKPKKFEKWTSAGGVVVQSLTEEGLRKVLLVAPKGNYGGYSWTFPKGRVDDGENLVKTAKREVKEESGIEASILPGGYLGVEEGTSSYTHYYMMVRVGGQEGVGTDGESSKVEWVSWADAFSRMKGSSRDKTILLRAWDFVRKLKKKLD